MINANWQRSSFSPDGGNNCVEVAATDDGVALRESDIPNELLTTGRTTLYSLIRSAKAGAFQYPPS
ncbi:DUF397 domain-containing protein [Streptomyces sp. NBC_00286]|uniref:DUF397 domain-containing protein n=1 Tax=Streptomyces sp. NBC_00286 TaxID=2975701 RepID=UPI002E2D9B46|nr:DUF397 domain-containing protein [Streptomyces sp. NBC_00286]